MISKIRYYFILICIFLIVCELPYNSKCESSESEELPTGDDEFGEVDSGIVSQKEFRKVMLANSNDAKVVVQSDSKSGESKLESNEPNNNKTNEFKSEQTKPEETKSEEVSPEETKEEETKPVGAKLQRNDSEELSQVNNKFEENKSDENKNVESKPLNSIESYKENENDLNDGSKKENTADGDNQKNSMEDNSTKNLDSEDEANNKDSSSSEVAQEEELASESTENLNDQSGDNKENMNGKNSDEKEEDKLQSTNKMDEKQLAADVIDKSNIDDTKNDSKISDVSTDNSKKDDDLENKVKSDNKLEENVEKAIQEMKDKLGANSEDETIKRVDDRFIVIVKKLKQKTNEIPTNTKDAEVRAYNKNEINLSYGKNEEEKSLPEEKPSSEEKSSPKEKLSSEEKPSPHENPSTEEKLSLEKKSSSEEKSLSKEKPSSEENKTESVNQAEEKKIAEANRIDKEEAETESREEKSNKELIEKLKSLSADNKKEEEPANQKIKKINNLLEIGESDEKMERLIQEKKDYDAKKQEKQKLPLQKKKKWYEKRDPITGELLFDAAALSRNITSTITAKRRKGMFSKCVQFHGQKENCESSKNCFYDSVYEMCLFDCSLLNKKDACEEYLECRFDFIVPRKACVNDCFQSRNFAKQEINGIMRGCMWCRQEVMCNTLSSLQKKKFPEVNNREFDCNWQLQNGLENDENTENSLCVDRNLGRSMTDKDLVAATYISSQTKLVHEAAEKIKDQMVNNGETEESAKLHVQNINLLKMNICYPPNIPYSQIKPEKKYYLNEEIIEIDCEDGYKITGANNQLRCENGLFSPKVYCIAIREIERQKSSISRHFNKILNLLINSITGNGEWINVGIEKINESKDQKRKESPDALIDENEVKTGEKEKKSTDDDSSITSSIDTNTTTTTTTAITTNTNQNKENIGKEKTNSKDKEKSKKGKDKNKKSTENENNEPKDFKSKELDGADKNDSELSEESSESNLKLGKNILLDRVTGTPILVQNN
ncbi:sushi domain-containing protein [Cryptosporidium ubiquitum]|uniref:Sushi domain-containing protein n=1 Tax=Cryptosporidium ubiquitum TaxID=857276 RepID=A0A1J4MHJ5_9CRYT|nr:sushi domain-containing protein [Cryptosporidium ubiquitum]OII73680.1 sushi domain-containing protein [Cryptosporidium ubiquitum]